MDWIQIVSALALVMFLVILFPAALQRMRDSPKGTSSDWIGFIVPMIVVVVFVILLIGLV